MSPDQSLAIARASAWAPLCSVRDVIARGAGMMLASNENLVENGGNQTPKGMRMLREEGATDEARNCLMRFWTDNQLADPHCNSTWDTVYCWPTTPANRVVSVPCFEIIQGLESHLAFVNASAYRICDEHGEWLWGNWTNYTECAILIESIEDLVLTREEISVTLVSYIGFIGSLISLVSLAIALFIFCYFKSLQCCRLSIHKNFVVSLIMRFILMIIVTEPSVSGREDISYGSVEWLCKLILAMKMYSVLSNVNWMFVEGFYLHSRITVSVFNTEAPFGFFYFVGWALPFINIVVWVIVMETQMKTFCWLGYSKSVLLWIIAGPLSFALLINFLFLINIVRILVTKLRANNTVETAQVKKAIKATAVLLPLLGTTNLLFFINPKDNSHLENAYIIINTVLQSSQGIFVSVLYCFLNSEVRSAIRKKYARLMLQRNPNSRRFARRKYSRSSSFFLSQYEPPEK